MSADRGSTAAGIVLFHPDPAALTRLLDGLSDRTAAIYCVLNSGIDAALDRRLAADSRVRRLGDGLNRGIGAAHNAILDTARADGYRRVFLFDQDSAPTAEMLRRVEQAFDDLVAANSAPAVVAPRLVAPAGSAAKPPRYQPWSQAAGPAGVTPVAFVPSSGSLVDLAAVPAIGSFRADYFIDGIDLEWCFRAWRRGYGCWVVDEATMEHPIGTGVLAWRFPPIQMPDQKPFRMYCYIRNTLYGLRLPHIPLGWRLKQLAYVPLQALLYLTHHRWRGTIAKLLGRGVLDGLRGKLGPPPGIGAA